MDYKEKLSKNINKNYLFIFLSRLNVIQGIWMIYLATKGMSLVQLGLLEGIFHITSFLMEVPTGVIADLYGRKTSRILGRLFSVISVTILIFSNGFYLFALSFIILAISYNLESGAGSALIYDSLKEMGKEDSYMKVAGREEIFLQVGSLTAFLIGGYLAVKSYRIAFVVSAIIAGITFIQGFFFVEPKIQSEKLKEKNPLVVLKKQVEDSLKVLRDNKKIGFLIIFCEVMSVFATSLFFYLQNYWKGSGYNEFKIGIIFAVSSLVAAWTASQAYKLEKKIKEQGVLLIMPIISVLSIWGIAITEYHYFFYIIMGGVQGIIFVVVNDYVNKLIPSENRATILSFQSMVYSFFMIFLFPAIGKIGDMYSLKFAFKILAYLGTVCTVVNSYIVMNIGKSEIMKKLKV